MIDKTLFNQSIGGVAICITMNPARRSESHDLTDTGLGAPAFEDQDSHFSIAG